MRKYIVVRGFLIALAVAIFFPFRSIAVPAGSGNSDIILGVLANTPKNEHFRGEPASDFVRVLFRKSAKDWKAYPTDSDSTSGLKGLVQKYPAHVSWTIAFDGRNAGQISTHVPSDFKWYSDVGREPLDTRQHPARIGKKTSEFGGYSDPGPAYRPLVAVSRPFVTDPEHWRREKPTKKELISVFAAFRKLNGKVYRCVKENAERRPWKYTDRDIQVRKVYASSQKSHLFQLELKGENADGDIECESFNDNWLLMTADGKVRSIGESMDLIDAGDYDGDGKSEVLFSISGNNLGGYKLFYDGLKKQATFSFSYH